MMKVNFSDLENYWESVDLEIQDLNEVVNHLLAKAHSDDDVYGQALIRLSSKIDTLKLKLTCIDLVRTHTIVDGVLNNIHYYYLDDGRVFKLNLKTNSLSLIHFE